MLADFLLTGFGIALLIGGGDAAVRGASALAARLGVSKLAIGLTVVAFGTSAPELAVNLTAAQRGQVELAFGNLFGSNLANLGLVIAVSALFGPLTIRNIVVLREVPMMMLATLVAATLALDAVWSAGANRIDRGDGMVLLLLFLIFIWYTLGDLLRARGQPTPDAPPDAAAQTATPRTKSILLTLAGFAGLALGGALTVHGAEGLARAAGIAPAVIGLTLVAVGTSLPELVASIIAGLRGHADLAIGNVVGSNICNLLIVLGATATIHPVPVPPGGHADLLAVITLSVLFWLMSATYGQRLIRVEAALLLLLYAGYMLLRV